MSGINFASLFNLKEELDRVLDRIDKRAELYWFFTITTDASGEVTFEGAADNYYQLESLLQEYVDDDLLTTIINAFASNDVYVSSQYDPTTLIDYQDTDDLEVSYCVMINIEEK